MASYADQTRPERTDAWRSVLAAGRIETHTCLLHGGKLSHPHTSVRRRRHATGRLGNSFLNLSRCRSDPTGLSRQVCFSVTFQNERARRGVFTAAGSSSGRMVTAWWWVSWITSSRWFCDATRPATRGAFGCKAALRRKHRSPYKGSVIQSIRCLLVYFRLKYLTRGTTIFADVVMIGDRACLLVERFSSLHMKLLWDHLTLCNFLHSGLEYNRTDTMFIRKHVMAVLLARECDNFRELFYFTRLKLIHYNYNVISRALCYVKFSSIPTQ